MMMIEKRSAEKTVRDIRLRTRKKYSAEEKIRIVLEGLHWATTGFYYGQSKANGFPLSNPCWRIKY